MNTSANNFDPIEKMIYEEGLRIETIHFHPELDVMLILLNTKAILRQTISAYPSLFKADKAALIKYELIGKGTGVSWPDLNEDLSLKGFLRDELRNAVSNNKSAFAA